MPARLTVGFIGLGQIGEPMALRVLAAGHRLVGHSRRAEGREALLAAGGELTASACEAARAADVLCINLFDDAQMRAVLLAEGALGALRPGAVLAVHTTGSPTLMTELAAAAPSGVDILDAAFSGTARQTAAGDLTLLIGGRKEALERARPVLCAYARTLIHLGGPGAGRKAKLINNLLFAAHASLAAEAVTAADDLGLDRTAFAQAVQHCSGASYAMAAFQTGEPVEAVLNRFRPYLDKDVDAARAAASEQDLSLPLLSVAARWGQGQTA